MRLVAAVFGGWMLILHPAFLHAQAGSSGMAFLKLGVSARGVALADAMAGHVSAAAATYYNPAGLLTGPAAGRTSQLMVMHKEWIQGTRVEFLGAGIALGGNDALGVSINTTTVSDIEIRTRPGSAEGTFTARNLSAGLSYARRLSDALRAGITAKFLYEKILVDDASGLAFDVGAQLDTPVEHLRVGAMVSNLGSVGALREEQTTLPALVRAGPAYSLDFSEGMYEILLASDVVHIFPERRSYLNAGGEFTVDRTVAVRGGYQFGSQGRGLAAGLGLSYGVLVLDYGFARLSSELGNAHTFSVSLNL